MRHLLIITACLALSACAAGPVSQSVGAQTSANASAQPFVMPMDPGQIRCAGLANPAALDAATDWTMGLIRGRILSGQRSAEPTRTDVSAALVRYCGANAGATIRAAAANSGV